MRLQTFYQVLSDACIREFPSHVVRFPWISFQVEDGVYIAPKILDSGYLVAGKKKLNFTRSVSGK